MDGKVKFSIVIPSFNQGRFLARALDSIITQNYPDIEIIIIDAESNDETLSVIKKYETEIAYWVSEPDRGQSDALNKGFAKATGDVFGWLNSDDIYCENAFEIALEAFKNNSNKKIVYGNWYEIDENDEVIERTFSAPRPQIPHFSYEGFDANLQSMFWKKEVHQIFGEFEVSLHQVMDSDFLFSIILDQGVDVFYKVDALLGAFRRHSAQKTERLRIDERAIKEQHYLDNKYDFPTLYSAQGFYHRVNYLFAKMGWSISQGGVMYTFKKFSRALVKRFWTY